jgi:ABC-type sugar transport system ATPase subunit
MTGGVELDRVSKRYAGNAKTTIEELSLTVEPGEFVVVLGPSGCGKSTALRLIAGLVAPTSGRISIAGRDVTHAAPRDRNVAMVFQNYALFPHLTVYENLAFGMRIRRVARTDIDGAVRRAAASTGLDALLDKKPKELSGGQSQRVALARALVRDPAVFLFDEPLSNLDPDLRGRMRVEIAEFRRRVGGTMLYVTHDQLEAMTLADRIVVMNDGRVRQIGAPLELYNEPVDQFVASFLGATPMNFIAAPAFARMASGDARVDPDTTIGVRPENIYLADRRTDDIDAGPAIDAVITAIETLGDGAIAHLAVNGQPLVARLRHQFAGRPGDALAVVIDRRRLCVFDREGRRVVENGAAH